MPRRARAWSMRRIRAGHHRGPPPGGDGRVGDVLGRGPGQGGLDGQPDAGDALANAVRTVSSGTASPAANASSARSAGRRPGRAFAASQTASSAAPGGGSDVLPRPRPG